jgi:hypothetical protein
MTFLPARLVPWALEIEQGPGSGGGSESSSRWLHFALTAPGECSCPHQFCHANTGSAMATQVLACRYRFCARLRNKSVSQSADQLRIYSN